MDTNSPKKIIAKNKASSTRTRSSSEDPSIGKNEWPGYTCERMPAGKDDSLVLNPGVMYVKHFATGGLLCSYMSADGQRIDMRVSRKDVEQCFSPAARTELTAIQMDQINPSFDSRAFLSELSAINPSRILGTRITHAEELIIKPFNKSNQPNDKSEGVYVEKESRYSSRKTNPKRSYDHNLGNAIKGNVVEDFIPSIEKNLRKAYSTLRRAAAPELARALTPNALKNIAAEKKRIKRGQLTEEEYRKLERKIARESGPLTRKKLLKLERELREDLMIDLELAVEREPVRIAQRDLQKSLNSDLDFMYTILYIKNSTGVMVLAPIFRDFQAAIKKNDLSSLTPKELLKIKARLSFLRDMYLEVNHKNRPELGNRPLNHASFQSDIENLNELLRIVDMAISLSKTSQRSFISSFTSIFSSTKEIDAKWLLKTDAEWKRDYKTLDEKTIRRWEKENAAFSQQYQRIGSIVAENGAKDIHLPQERSEKDEIKIEEISSTGTEQLSSFSEASADAWDSDYDEAQLAEAERELDLDIGPMPQLSPETAPPVGPIMSAFLSKSQSINKLPQTPFNFYNADPIKKGPQKIGPSLTPAEPLRISNGQ